MADAASSGCVVRLVDYTGDARAQSVADMLGEAQEIAEVQGATMAVLVMAKIGPDGVHPFYGASGVDALQAVGLLELAKAYMQEGGGDG